MLAWTNVLRPAPPTVSPSPRRNPRQRSAQGLSPYPARPAITMLAVGAEASRSSLFACSCLFALLANRFPNDVSEPRRLPALRLGWPGCLKPVHPAAAGAGVSQGLTPVFQQALCMSRGAVRRRKAGRNAVELLQRCPSTRISRSPASSCKSGAPMVPTVLGGFFVHRARFFIQIMGHGDMP